MIQGKYECGKLKLGCLLLVYVNMGAYHIRNVQCLVIKKYATRTCLIIHWWDRNIIYYIKLICIIIVGIRPIMIRNIQISCINYFQVVTGLKTSLDYQSDQNHARKMATRFNACQTSHTSAHSAAHNAYFKGDCRQINKCSLVTTKWNHVSFQLIWSQLLSDLWVMPR